MQAVRHRHGDAEEVIAELRVIRSHKYSSLALVTESREEIEPGDQEAIRNVVRRGRLRVRDLDESDVSCLPEFVRANALPTAIHFKGPSRKNQMGSAAQQLGIE